VTHRRGFARWLVTALVGSTLLVLSTLARGADPAVEDVRLRYVADPACPSETRFIDEVLARTARARFAPADLRARVVQVMVQRHASEFHGRLTLVAPEAPARTSETREIAGADCNSIVTALALFTALAIDPHALVSGRPPPDDPSPRAAVSEAGVPPNPAWHVLFGLDLEAWLLMAPAGMYGGSLSALAGQPAGPPLSVRLRVSAGYLQSPDVYVGPGLASASLPNLAIAVCPLEAALSRSAILDVCSGARVGLFRANGWAGFFPGRTTTTSGWGDVELRVGVAWWSTDRWALQVSADGVVPFTRDALGFDRSWNRYEPLAVGFGTTLGVVWDASGAFRP
jgi:hypothetical protein